MVDDAFAQILVERLSDAGRLVVDSCTNSAGTSNAATSETATKLIALTVERFDAALEALVMAARDVDATALQKSARLQDAYSAALPLIQLLAFIEAGAYPSDLPVVKCRAMAEPLGRFVTLILQALNDIHEKYNVWVLSPFGDLFAREVRAAAESAQATARSTLSIGGNFRDEVEAHEAESGPSQRARGLLPGRIIKTPRDAEYYARDYLNALGFQLVEVTPATRDRGVDVRGADVVAQVKMEGIKTKADRLQALFGNARHEAKAAAFFSLGGYSRDALKWAEETGMGLFEFDYGGGIAARSVVAAGWVRRALERKADASMVVDRRVSGTRVGETPPPATPGIVQRDDEGRGDGLSSGVQRGPADVFNRAQAVVRGSAKCFIPGCDYLGPPGTCPTHDA